MKILITGANGQLGNEMQVLAKENTQHDYIFTDVQELDICDEQAVRTFVKENGVEVIVNCAAYTNVERAEDDVEQAQKINAEAVAILAAAAKSANATLILFVCATFIYMQTQHLFAFCTTETTPLLPCGKGV